MQFGEARQVGWIHDLRVFVPPAWLGDLALACRHRVEGALVFIEHEAVGPVADGVGLHLNALLECGD